MRAPAFLGGTLMLLLLSLIVHSTRDGLISCVRDGSGQGGGYCRTANATYDLGELVALDLESGRFSDATEPGTTSTLSMLVLVTRTKRVPLERGASAYAWDSRPEAVSDFADFLRDAKRSSYPRPFVNVKVDVATGAPKRHIPFQRRGGSDASRRVGEGVPEGARSVRGASRYMQYAK